MSSSDDFFSNELGSPPKQTASLNSAPSSSSTSRQRIKQNPPPPPPRRTNPPATAAAAAPASSASANTTRPRPTPSRPAGATSAATGARTTPRPTTTSSAPGNTSSVGTTANSSGQRPTPSRPLPTARQSRTGGPVMSRPVGQYYASSGNPASGGTATPAGTNFYGAPSPAHAANQELEDPAMADTWDWGTPNPAPAVNVNNWAAPSTAHGNATGAGGGANAMYTSSGFYGGGGGNSNTSTSATLLANNGFQPSSSEYEPFLSGSMDDSNNMNNNNNAPAAPGSMLFTAPKAFIPQANSMGSLNSGGAMSGNNSSDPNLMTGDEAPLLEELGVNLEHIGMKTKAVILPLSRFGGTQMEPADIVQDADLAGPIAFALILGAEMVLTGKLQFGYIYGFGVFGCLSMTLIVNLMSPVPEGISVWTVSSVLGYALIPVNVLAAVKLIVINLVNLQTLGRILGLFTVAWSTVASTRLLELGCGLQEQRYLIAYPVALLYSAFVMITIF